MPNYNASASLNARQFVAAIGQMTQAVQTFHNQTSQSMQNIEALLARSFRNIQARSQLLQQTVDQQLHVQQRQLDMERRIAMETAKTRMATSRSARATVGFIKALRDGDVKLGRTAKAIKNVGSTLDWLPVRSAKAERALLQIGSASQGAMLGLGILQGSIQSIGFSVIFLRWGIIKIALAFTALTVAIGFTAKAIRGWIALVRAAVSTGKAFEASMQRIASYFQSAEIANAIESQAEIFSRTFGIARKEARAAFVELQKIGLAQMEYARAFGNIAVATGQSVDDVTKEFVQAFRQGGEAVQDFVKKYDLGLAQVTNTAEVAKAANERFKNSLEDWAQTAAGMQARLGAAWESFLIQAGRVFNEIMKTVFEPLIALVDGMISGFRAAEEQSRANGELARTLNDVRNAARLLAPILFTLGELLGRVIYRSAILAARALKTLYDAMRAGARFLKEHKDTIFGFASGFKQNFLSAITVGPGTIAAITAFARAFIAAMIGAFARESVDEIPESIFRRIARAFMTVPTAIFRPIFAAIGAALPRGIVGSIRFSADMFVDVFTGLLRALAGAGRAVLAAPGAIFRGLFAGLKAGLITGIITALALTVTDLLPIGENLKTVISSVIVIAMTAFAVASVFSASAGLIAAAIVAALVLALEQIRPGSAKQIADTIDKIIREAIDKVPELIDDAWTKLKEFNEWLLGDGQKGPSKYVSKYGEIGHAFEDVSDDHERETPRIERAWQAVLNAVTPVTNYIKTETMDAWDMLWKRIREPVMGALEAASNFITNAVAPALESLWGVIEQLGSTLNTLWQIIDDPVKNALEWLSGFAGEALALGAIPAFSGAIIMAHSALDLLTSFINRMVIPALKAIEAALGLIEALLTGDWDRAWKETKTLIDNLIRLQLAPLHSVLDMVKSVLDMISDFTGVDIWGGIKEGFEEIKKAVDALLTPLREAKSIFDAARDWKLPGTNIKPSGIISTVTSGLSSVIPGFQHGGVVPGPRGKKRLAIVEGGERFLKHPLFDAALAGRGPRTGGDQSVTLNVFISGSVVTNEQAMEMLANQISDKMIRQFRLGRAMTGIRVG